MLNRKVIMASVDEEDNHCGDVTDESETDLLEDVYLYLTKKQYLHEGITQNQKRVIRRKATNFHTADGEMMFSKKKKGKNEVHELRYTSETERNS